MQPLICRQSISGICGRRLGKEKTNVVTGPVSRMTFLRRTHRGLLLGPYHYIRLGFNIRSFTTEAGGPSGGDKSAWEYRDSDNVVETNDGQVTLRTALHGAPPVVRRFVTKRDRWRVLSLFPV